MHNALALIGYEWMNDKIIDSSLELKARFN